MRRVRGGRRRSLVGMTEHGLDLHIPAHHARFHHFCVPPGAAPFRSHLDKAGVQDRAGMTRCLLADLAGPAQPFG
jgi:hypothetical protein